MVSKTLWIWYLLKEKSDVDIIFCSVCTNNILNYKLCFAACNWYSFLIDVINYWMSCNTFYCIFNFFKKAKKWFLGFCFCYVFTTRYGLIYVQTPLDSSSVDVAVFCLSLMGTNYSNYLQEAKRVLKPRLAPWSLPGISLLRCDLYVVYRHSQVPWCSGWLLIAEVRSRFDPNTGGADPEKFFEAVSQLGFSLVSKVCSLIYNSLQSITQWNIITNLLNLFYNIADVQHVIFQDFSNKMFVLFYFKKAVRLLSFVSCTFIIGIFSPKISITATWKINLRCWLWLILFNIMSQKKDSQVESIKWPELKPCIYKRRWASFPSYEPRNIMDADNVYASSSTLGGKLLLYVCCLTVKKITAGW